MTSARDRPGWPKRDDGWREGDRVERGMVLIQLLLPLMSETHPGAEGTPLARTREELTRQFKALTAYVRAPAKGLWTSPDGRREEDDVVMVEIVAPAFDREWWRAYGETLRRRFRQETIHVRAIPIEMLDADAS